MAFNESHVVLFLVNHDPLRSLLRDLGCFTHLTLTIKENMHNYGVHCFRIILFSLFGGLFLSRSITRCAEPLSRVHSCKY